MCNHSLRHSPELHSLFACNIVEDRLLFFFFFFNDTATTEIYTLSLHDALPISAAPAGRVPRAAARGGSDLAGCLERRVDRKSTRLNSSHGYISYAVFCLKKKKNRLSPNIPPITGRPAPTLSHAPYRAAPSTVT